ncbi:MAG: BrnT family toxin [Bacteriovorax sp.]|nr:BrnT family toxin [Rhizobacter sp.]
MKAHEHHLDAAKDAANIAKHGVSLVDAERLEWDTLSARADWRRDDGELRVIGFAYVGLRLHCVVFTDRGDERRVIILRKANAREVADHAKT